MPLLLVFTKEIFKNTKENMPSEEICSHFSQEGQINLIFPPYCCICIALSIDTHMSYSESHIAVWLYGYMAIIWKYGHMARWLYGFYSSQYGCLSRKLYKCSNLVKTLSWLDHPVRNESQFPPRAYFPLYFLRFPL